MQNQYEVELPNNLSAVNLANLARAMVTKGKSENMLVCGWFLRGHWGNSSIYLESTDGEVFCKIIPA